MERIIARKTQSDSPVTLIRLYAPVAVMKDRTMLGDLMTHLDRPDVAANVLTTLDPIVALQIAKRAAAETMTSADFVAGAVRDFVERADDDLWFQLLTIIRKAEDPGLAAIQTILQWVAIGGPGNVTAK
jgi:hypothetical protein